MHKPTLDEQETIIRFDRGSDTASIYTSDPSWMRKLDDLAAKTNAVQLKNAAHGGRWYEYAPSP